MWSLSEFLVIASIARRNAFLEACSIESLSRQVFSRSIDSKSIIKIEYFFDFVVDLLDVVDSWFILNFLV